MRTTILAFSALLIAACAGCTPSELAHVRMITVDPYEGRAFDVTPEKAAEVGTKLPAELPLRDVQINSRQTHAFLQNARRLKVVSLVSAEDVATTDRVISARWSPDGQKLLLVLDAATYGNDVYEARITSPDLQTIRTTRFRAPGYRKLLNQGLALSWSADGGLVAIGPQEDVAGWTLIDPSKLSVADAPAVFIIDSDSMQRTPHPGYHSAYFLSASTLIASRGDRLLVVNSDFKELGDVKLDQGGNVVGSDPVRGLFVYELTKSHASFEYGAHEYWLVQHPQLKKAKLPRGGTAMTFVGEGAPPLFLPPTNEKQTKIPE